MLIERSACLVCGSERLTELYRRPYGSGPVRDFLFRYYGLEGRAAAKGWEARFGGTDYLLQGCAECRAVTQRFAPGPELAAEIYGGWIDGEDRFRGYPFGEYTHRLREAMALTALLLRHHGLASPAELKVLDFGAGWGSFALALRACGCEVWAAELSPSRVERMRRDGLGIVGEDEIAGAGFHFINTEQVFEHLPQPAGTARRLHAGLGPRGVLKISVPFSRRAERDPIAIDWEGGREGPRSWMPFQPLEHLTYFRRPSLAVMAGRLGMAEIRTGWRDELDAALGWSRPRDAVRNVGRLLPRRWFRNHFLFAKR